MSTIELMGIQGIRSFGPDEADFQRVKFFKPLTLILGPNGTGKTTIIECLKYATTGDMPPGSKGAGAAFVHDPKLANEREIKGQIKLMIRDVSGAACTVERSMAAKVKDIKGKKVEMKSLDGVLTRRSPDGETHSITSKCADLNREMTGALGVSKAVLENVIFCHQEDSNWPLSEGKALKDKFDAIFASTRYTKVLDELKKLKQNQDQEIREGKRDVEYLKQHKQKSEQLQRDLEELEAKQAASIDNVRKIHEDMAPIKQELQNLNVRCDELFKLQATEQKFKDEQELIKRTICDLSEKITQDFQGSTAELKMVLKDFSAQVKNQKAELEEHERQQEKLKRDIDKLLKDKSLLLVEGGKLQKEYETHVENMNKRDVKMYELSQLYQFEGFEEDMKVTEDKYGTFFTLMTEKLESVMGIAKKTRADFEEKEQQVQTKIDSLKETKTKLEHSDKIKKEAISRNKAEIQSLNKKLNEMASSADRLTHLATELKQAENDLSKAEVSLNVHDVKKEIADLDCQKRKLEATMNDLNMEMNRLLKLSKFQTELKMLEENQKDKEAHVEKLRIEHEDSLVSLLGYTPLDDLRETLSTYISNQSENVKKCTEALNKLKHQLTLKQADKNSTTSSLRQKEEELRELEAKMYSACENADLEEELTEVQKNLSQAQEEKGSLQGADHLIKKYMKNLEKNNPTCPLCQRHFQQAQEVRELILKLQEQLRRVPANMKKAEEDVKKYQKKCNDLMQLKPLKVTATSMKEKDIPNLKRKLSILDEEMKRLKEELQNKEEDCNLQESDLHTAKHIQPDVVDMDRRRAEVRELEKKIQEQRIVLSGGQLTGTVDEVIKEKEEKQLELETVNRRLDHRKEKLENYREQTQELRCHLTELQQEKLTLKGEMQQKIKLEERRAALISEINNHERDIEEARTQLRPLEDQIMNLVQGKKVAIKKKEQMIDVARREEDDVRSNFNIVEALNIEIKNYIQSGRSEKLKENQDKCSQLSTMQTKKAKELEELTLPMKRLSNVISTEQIRERELKDTLELRNKQVEVKNLEQKIAELEHKLGELSLDHVERERQKLFQKEIALSQKLSVAEGRQQGFKDQIQTLRKELESDMYRDAGQKYRSKIIENRTLEITNGDLQRYYGAMDKALMMYHKSKMDEINIIIRELWKNTYTGNDIETIEVQSEAEDAPGTNTIKSRRNYNYRVVMIKNGIPVDMRGRCSAGQKVLASLIIRLALAETFCVNCGVLALDEPTTNLDRNNIQSLALALVQIIKERNSQRHFQLVIITHDEDFVELLGRSEYVDEYIQVSKSADGLSRLTVKKIQELQS